jgi:alpha-beta hydrolase superfamily lysophospholipase
MSRGWLHTSDDVLLARRHWPASNPRAAVVLVHGFSASKDDPAVVALGEELSTRGFDVTSYDARGHGRSEGECTLGDHERLDVAAAVDDARARASNVVLVGASMGAIAVIRAAENDPDVAGVVAVSSPAQWRLPRNGRAILAAAITQTRPGRWLAGRHLRVRLARRWTRAESPLAVATRVTVPLAVVHGDNDRFIPASEATLLASTTGGPRRLSLVAGMGHAFDSAGLSAICEAVEWVVAHRLALDTPVG